MPCVAQPIESRFWPKVAKAANDNDCWAWRGAKNSHGYGVIGIGGRGTGNAKAHRVSYEIHYGVSLTPDQVVMHRCDNPQCTNPMHLRLGTQLDNIEDMNAKRRGQSPPVRRGGDNNKAKINEEIALAIMSEPRGWGMRKKCAAKYGVSESIVKSIQTNKTWKHLQGGTTSGT